MTNEDRISRLWNQAKNFRVVTAGDGDISGGFGSFPSIDDSYERLNHLEKAVARFTLSGNNVQVSGSFDSGYILT